MYRKPTVEIGVSSDKETSILKSVLDEVMSNVLEEEREFESRRISQAGKMKRFKRNGCAYLTLSNSITGKVYATGRTFDELIYNMTKTRPFKAEDSSVDMTIHLVFRNMWR